LMKRLLRIFFCVILMCSVSYAKNTVNIQSYILRNRVVVLDQVTMKKALYVSFSFSGSIKQHGNLNVHGLLLNGDKIVSETSLKAFSENNGNLVFDLPYQISDGEYTIKIDVLANNGSLAGTGSVAVKRSALKSYSYPGGEISARALEEIPVNEELEEVKPTIHDKSVGYMIFSRSPLEYVFPGSKPKKSEIIEHAKIGVVRNEFEPFTFSLYPLQNLGTVKISVTDLKSAEEIISKNKIRVACVEIVQETIGLPEGRFLDLPTLIRPGNQVRVEKGRCQRFWLTIRIDDNVLPGEYKGRITISPQHGLETSLPFEITVSPISLEDIPGIDYFMLMTYEFTELTMPWRKEEKEKIYQSACNILKDYHEHGMTTLCLHSPFVLITKEEGTPNLEDIFAALRAAKEMGFKRRIIWYMGHLIQTSKPKHPGSIMGFDKRIHSSRLKYIVETVSQYAKEHGCPEVIFLPIDEPGDSYQDFQHKRQAITPVLLKVIKDSGAKNMLTGGNYKQFRPIDYLCSSKVNKEDLDEAHKSGSVFWLYNNDVTTKCLNPTYARYIYGYYTWMNHVDGMSSWTFQNTQNARNLPRQADVHGSDIYLAYPDPNGPIATLKWEAIREGIDDHKLLYQLVKRIKKLEEKGIDTSKYREFLLEIRKRQGTAGCQIGDEEKWNPAFFEKNRDHLILMILDAEARIN
jgi:Glycoside hydrolase 123, N-terminal domain